MTDRNDAHEPAEAAHEDAHENVHEDAEAYESEAAPPARQPRPRRRPPRREVREAPIKSPLLAAFLGFVPGLGNIYNGLYARGFVFFLLVVSLFYAAIDVGNNGKEEALALLIPSLIFTWLFNIFDGYRQATLINWGWDEREEIAAQQGSGGLAAGIALFAIGIYGLLHQFFDIDLSALLEHWYLVLLAIGGWLIYQSWGEKKSEESTDSY